MQVTNLSLKNQNISYLSYESDKGLILTGKNASGKSKKLKEIENKISSLQDINIVEILHLKSIESIFINQLNLTEVNLSPGASTIGLYNYIETYKKKIEKEISEIFSISRFELDTGFQTISYDDNTEITSDGHKNMIMLAILSLYFIYNGSNYLLIDEPNSHLDDYNSENLIENLRSIIEKFDYDIP